MVPRFSAWYLRLSGLGAPPAFPLPAPCPLASPTASSSFPVFVRIVPASWKVFPPGWPVPTWLSWEAQGRDPSCRRPPSPRPAVPCPEVNFSADLMLLCGGASQLLLSGLRVV